MKTIIYKKTSCFRLIHLNNSKNIWIKSDNSSQLRLDFTIDRFIIIE